jgi:nucleoside-diphosphate-sugar epimerase
MKRFAVTGAHGFVGRALCAALVAQNFPVTGVVRRLAPLTPGVAPWLFNAVDFAGVADAWVASGPACDCVIHLAARVHMMQDAASDPLAEYRAANVDGVLRVAEAAVKVGAKRFIFVSSVKALGDVDRGVPWREDDVPLALDAYGTSKREAEQALLALGRETGLEVVIVRPPLVYGPGVRANFLRLLNLIEKRLPLPLGAVNARRSLVSIYNLVDALILCATHDAAPGRIFHVTDGVDFTTAELVLALGQMLQRPARLVPVPPALLRLAGRLAGRSAEVGRLISPLQIDSSRILNELGWRPPLSVEQGLLETVQWYRSKPRC